jgi:glycosyltransferase involved in cell wall biosynthesis
MPGRVVYYMGDYWPTLPDQFENYWQASPRNFLTGIPKLLLKPLAQRILASEKKPVLNFEHIIFPTEFMQSELNRMGVLPREATIVYGAIDTSLYSVDHKVKDENDNVALLYVGRLTREKGVHTAIQALGYLKRNSPVLKVALIIVGSGEPDYEIYLRQLVLQEDVEALVTFLDSQPKETLPALYRKADIFLFTSIWPEPFGRVIVEAMASGVVVVGTRVGGAAEILQDGVNALAFTPDDPVSLAQQLSKLIASPELRGQLIENGREAALDRFDITRMTNGIEVYLQAMADK